MDVDSVNREKAQLNISYDSIPSPMSELELIEVNVIQASDSSDDDFQNIDRIHYKKSQPTVNKIAGAKI
ncbi:unnamed protein product [Allacma fusca]|uniref:Uncharacterized protein n=1 Tax=Allacma fusca TaxID=39272 RepID=A0A8J2L8Y9_9HEXA|nr:unnamed protein product [Allacma fusca]